MNSVEQNSFLNSLTHRSRQAASENAEKSKENEKGDNKLGQTAFLNLLVTQLNNQDPLNPAENTEFIAQLAQFSSVEGIDRLNNSFDSMNKTFNSNQALQASSLVGRTVAIPTDSAFLLQDSVISGSVNVPESTPDLAISVYNKAGSLVEKIPVGLQTAGDMIFRWDGKDIEINGKIHNFDSMNTEKLQPGEYRFEITATQKGETEQLKTALGANVNSVTIGKDGQIQLNLAGKGKVALSDVKQFN